MKRAGKMTFAEIAGQLGLSVQEVQIAYATGIRKLRRRGHKPVETLRSLAERLCSERDRRAEVA